MSARPLRGRTVVITCGPTREHLDPIRFLTNASSGRMGLELARAARAKGAKVVVVSGPTGLSFPSGVVVEPVVSARQMLRKALARSRRADVFIGAAAVGDWRFAKVSSAKIKKTGRPMSLKVIPNPDIIASVSRRRGSSPRPYMVGFALETHRWLSYARRKLEGKRLDMVVANRTDSLGGEMSRLALLWKDGRLRHFPRASKAEAARGIIESIGKELHAR